MARVLWPLISMATRSGTPARTMLRTAVRRRSWKSLAGILRSVPSASVMTWNNPALIQALAQARDFRREGQRTRRARQRERAADDFEFPVDGGRGGPVALPLLHVAHQHIVRDGERPIAHEGSRQPLHPRLNLRQRFQRVGF